MPPLKRLLFALMLVLIAPVPLAATAADTVATNPTETPTMTNEAESYLELRELVQTAEPEALRKALDTAVTSLAFYRPMVVKTPYYDQHSSNPDLKAVDVLNGVEADILKVLASARPRLGTSGDGHPLELGMQVHVDVTGLNGEPIEPKVYAPGVIEHPLPPGTIQVKLANDVRVIVFPSTCYVMVPEDPGQHGDVAVG